MSSSNVFARSFFRLFQILRKDPIRKGVPRRRAQQLHLEHVEARLVPAGFVLTDLLDYPPGSTALISAANDQNEGTNFTPGETIQFQVTRTDGIQDYASGNLPWVVTDGISDFDPYTTADGTRVFPDLDGATNGHVDTSWFVENQYASSSLLLTATGLASGAIATHEFTDGSPIQLRYGGTQYQSPASAFNLGTVNAGTPLSFNVDAINLISASDTVNFVLTDPGTTNKILSGVTFGNFTTSGTTRTTTATLDTSTLPLTTGTVYTLEIVGTDTNPAFNANNASDKIFFKFTAGTVITPAAGSITSVSVSAASASTTYGTASNVNYTVTPVRGANGNVDSAYSISGLPSGVTASFNPVNTTGTGSNALTTSTLTLNVPATVPAGSYTFTVSVGGVSTTGTLVVNKTNLTITASNKSKTYGDSLTLDDTWSVGDPVADFTATGLKNTDTVTKVTLASSGTAYNAAFGSYSITASAATGSFSASNYNISYVNGSLTVNKKAITITADNEFKVVGQSFVPVMTNPNGQFKAAPDLVLGDSISSVTLTSAGYDSSASIGTYPITVSGAQGSNLGNYTISYAPGILAVTDKFAAVVDLGSNYASTTTSESSPVYGTNITFTAVVSADTFTLAPGQSAPSAPSGFVQFYDENGPIGAPKEIVAGVATFSIDTLHATKYLPVHQIMAEYLGNSEYNPQQSDDLLQAVNTRALTITATPGQNKVYGSADPATYVYSLTSGELFGTDTLSGDIDRAHGEDVNTYAYELGTVTAGTDDGLDYDITLAPGVFSITKASSTTVTVGAGPYTYNGSAQVGGSGTVTGVNLDTATLVRYAANSDGSGVADQTNAGTYYVQAYYEGDSNHTGSEGLWEAIVIGQASSTTVTVGAGPFTYNGSAQVGGSGTVTGVNLDTATLVRYAANSDGSGVADQTNAGTYYVQAYYEGDSNHTGSEGLWEAITIAKASSTTVITIVGAPFVYNGSAQTPATVSVTGAGGLSLAPQLLSSNYSNNTNAGTATVTYTFAGDSNHIGSTDTKTFVINKATANITVTPYSVTYDTLAHTATASATGVDAGGTAAGTSFNLSGTIHTVAGTYSDSWTFNGGTNYNSASGTITDVISARSALVNYIGQTTWVTSGTSSTTAQVTLTASMQDPTGCALKNATVDFIDDTNGKVLASGVKVSQVIGTGNTGTASTIVTLSTGQYGSEAYVIRVVLTGNYTNSTQSPTDKTATVVVSKPAATNETTGGGCIASTNSAGVYGGGNANLLRDISFSIGMAYNKSGSNLQGKITLEVPQADGSILYVKSNSISSMAVSNVTGGKLSTIYTKATVYKVLNGVTTTIDGNVTFRIDAFDANTAGYSDAVGFTVLSSKDSSLYFSSDWKNVSNVWKTAVDTLKKGSITIN